MLSRRNVRIKVMQILYALGRENGADAAGVLQQYRQSISHSFELYLFNLMIFRDLAGYAAKDAANRKAKLRPTDKDKAFSAKLRDNDLTMSVINNPELPRYLNAFKLTEKLEEDDVRRFYLDFAKTEAYEAYLASSDDSPETHKAILLELFKYSINGEAFNEYIEDQYPLWFDDKSLVVGAMKKTIKSLPAEELFFFREYEPTDETIKEFGEQLLLYVTENDRTLLDIIEPALNNWDSERVAVIDMILIKMALAEFMNFPTIPTKVTLNEFVEIAKMYSTDKSRDFVNGILDRLMKKLHKDGKIKKEGRGLQGEEES